MCLKRLPAQAGALRSTVAAAIQLLACGYPARCSVRRCQVRATTVARYTDDQGRPLKQRELCERHAEWLRANREERAGHNLAAVDKRLRRERIGRDGLVSMRACKSIFLTN
jgi:hypothetical protein